HRLADLVTVLLDGVLGHVLDLTDPFGRDGVEPHEDLALALQLRDRATVAPDERVDLLAGERGDLRVESAEADDFDVAIRVPALRLGEHAREDPRGGADPRDTDGLAFQLGRPA